MKSKLSPDLGNEKGSALLLAIMILMVVTAVGFLASRSAVIDLKGATNDKVHKRTWFATDAVVDGLMPELIEQNIAERGFGSLAPPFPYGNSGNLEIFNSEFYLNDVCTVPTETNQDVQANGLTDTTVHVSVFSTTKLTPGNAIQLPEGYHGRGKGMAGGGAQLLFIIRGLGKGAANSEARVASGWRHQT